MDNRVYMYKFLMFDQVQNFILERNPYYISLDIRRYIFNKSLK
jgi:hypothetical protein